MKKDVEKGEYASRALSNRQVRTGVLFGIVDATTHAPPLDLRYGRCTVYGVLRFTYIYQPVNYGKEAEPLLSKTEFLNDAPLVIIDCSKQNELLKTGPVDNCVEFESHANFPAETKANCLIVHDRIVDYSPLSGDVNKRV